jgi:hypothetical protein
LLAETQPLLASRGFLVISDAGIALGNNSDAARDSSQMVEFSLAEVEAAVKQAKSFPDFQVTEWNI